MFLSQFMWVRHQVQPVWKALTQASQEATVKVACGRLTALSREGLLPCSLLRLLVASTLYWLLARDINQFLVKGLSIGLLTHSSWLASLGLREPGEGEHPEEKSQTYCYLLLEVASHLRG